MIEIPKDLEVNEPSFIRINPASTDANALHIVVVAGMHSNSTMVLDHIGQGVLGGDLGVQGAGGAQFLLGLFGVIGPVIGLAPRPLQGLARLALVFGAQLGPAQRQAGTLQLPAAACYAAPSHP